MIVYITTRLGRRSIAESYPHLPDDLRRRVKLTNYHTLPRQESLPVASYIFADIERLTGEAAAGAAGVWDRLASSGQPVRLFNHPTRVLTRYRLLRALHRAGINDFDVHRAERSDDDEPGAAIRYPVFLRGMHDHEGARSDLIHDAAALEAALRRLEADGLSRSEVLIVEFCDTVAADGIYRKYDAFVAGDRIVPTDMYHSSRWMLKWENSGVFDGAPMSPGELSAAELGFMAGFAHHDRLREIATVARIDYGRIDFAWRGDRIQTWEINTNPDPALPQLLAPKHRNSAYGRRVLPAALDALYDMYRSLDCAGDPAEEFPMPPTGTR